MNADLPHVDKIEFGELGDEAWAADEYIVPGLLFEFVHFVCQAFGSESCVVPGYTFNGAREKNFRDVVDRVSEVVHVMVAGGLLDDGGPEGFHKLVGGATIENGAGAVEHVGVVIMYFGVRDASGMVAESVESYIEGGDYFSHGDLS